MGELMGRTISAGREQETPFRALPNVSAGPGCHAFAETGHTLCGGFRGYWEANGGLWMFGYPSSEEFQERNEDTGVVYTVQHFERARFEWHPENAGTAYEVLLGRLGARLYAARYECWGSGVGDQGSGVAKYGRVSSETWIIRVFGHPPVRLPEERLVWQAAGGVLKLSVASRTMTPPYLRLRS